MKLSITLLLITLALFCSEANAMACPAAVIEAGKFILEPDPVYEAYLKMYNVPSEDIRAKLQVKQCAKQLSYEDKILVAKVVAKIVWECGF